MFKLLGNLRLGPRGDSISAQEYKLHENLAGLVSGLPSLNRSTHRVQPWLPVTMEFEVARISSK